MDSILPILKEFGFPVALCAVLLWAIRSQNAQLVKAYTDRISTLERIVKGLTDKVEALEVDRIRRADEYGHTIKDLAIRLASVTKETNEVIRSTLQVMRKLCDSIAIRPCMMDEYHPHKTPPPRPPTSGELPDDPAKAETDRHA
jgi:hypothetical protein